MLYLCIKSYLGEDWSSELQVVEAAPFVEASLRSSVGSSRAGSLSLSLSLSLSHLPLFPSISLPTLTLSPSLLSFSPQPSSSFLSLSVVGGDSFFEDRGLASNVATRESLTQVSDVFVFLWIQQRQY